MRVLMVVAASRYTGAAAVAEHCCRALIRIGTDTSLLFIGGNNLEQRLTADSWAYPILVKERSLRQLRANLAAIRTVGRSADVVISHLPHDHFLCVAAGAHRWSRLVRSIRSSRHLRRDPYHRYLMRRAAAVFVAHSEMNPSLKGCGCTGPSMVSPVPIEDRFKPGLDPAIWRRRLAIPDSASVIGMVGKLASQRGFDTLLETTALVQATPHLVVVGHGESQPALERQARRLGLDHRTHWCGYQEAALPELYTAIDVVVFTAPGSDHGHRTISEAQACGRLTVAREVAGVRDLIEHGINGMVAPQAGPRMAEMLDQALAASEQTLSSITTAAVAAAECRRFLPVGQRLSRFLAALEMVR
jgi:glycosyltransferase involved in cell wall biosynthesis